MTLNANDAIIIAWSKCPKGIVHKKHTSASPCKHCGSDRFRSIRHYKGRCRISFHHYDDTKYRLCKTRPPQHDATCLDCKSTNIGHVCHECQSRMVKTMFRNGGYKWRHAADVPGGGAQEFLGIKEETCKMLKRLTAQ